MNQEVVRLAPVGDRTMSTFYLLPPRPALGEHLTGFLRGVLPGLDWDTATRAELAETIAAAASAHRDVFVVYREDLPQGEPPARALVDGFGAAAGDEVIEVRPGALPGELTARRWRVA
jgi:hypothetical protein